MYYKKAFIPRCCFIHFKEKFFSPPAAYSATTSAALRDNGISDLTIFPQQLHNDFLLEWIGLIFFWKIKEVTF